MFKESRLEIYKLVVRSITAYAVETRTKTVKSKQTVDTTDTLRKICGATLRDQRRSEEMRGKYGVQHINDK